MGAAVISRVKVYQFKTKDFEIKQCAFCLGNISKNSVVITWKRMDSMDMSMIFLMTMVI